MTDRDEAAKKAILARRAKFVAAAVATLGVACGKEPAPHACLSVEPTQPADAAPPAPCLTAAPTPEAPPAPCLSTWQPSDAGPPPRPCLKVKLKTDGGDP